MLKIRVQHQPGKNCHDTINKNLSPDHEQKDAPPWVRASSTALDGTRHSPDTESHSKSSSEVGHLDVSYGVWIHYH